MTKKARADAKKAYANHEAEGSRIWYPWAASDKPWPEHRWLEVDSRSEYGEKGGLAYQAQWRELFWAEVYFKWYINTGCKVKELTNNE